jgi:hypothetical protein
MLREKAQVAEAMRRSVSMRRTGADRPVRATKVRKSNWSKRVGSGGCISVQPETDEAMHATKAKSYNIDKKLVYDACKAVKDNAGAAGVDQLTIEQPFGWIKTVGGL